jgi:hypothetical protein
MDDPLGPTDGGEDGSDYPGAPRWVKVFGIIIAIPILLFVILMLAGGPGRHGPGRHFGPGDAGESTPPPSVPDEPPPSGGDGGGPVRPEGARR